MATSMTTDALRFKEIEHKFLVDGQFDLDAFGRALEALGPTYTSHVQVEDRYFVTDSGVARGFIVRHRFDHELHHLTVKTMNPDTEVRNEVNLDLGHHAGSQRAQVDAFVAQFGVRWSGTIHKDLRVWLFDDAEVVHYEASSPERTVRCVEFEATHKQSVEDALAIVARYEHATGFDARERTPLALLQLLFPEIEALMGLAG